jgi:hypothetical protein
MSAEIHFLAMDIEQIDDGSVFLTVVLDGFYSVEDAKIYADKIKAALPK